MLNVTPKQLCISDLLRVMFYIIRSVYRYSEWIVSKENVVFCSVDSSMLSFP